MIGEGGHNHFDVSKPRPLVRPRYTTGALPKEHFQGRDMGPHSVGSAVLHRDFADGNSVGPSALIS